MKGKILGALALAGVLFAGCGSDFPGQPSGVVKVEDEKFYNGNLRSETPYNDEGKIHGFKREFYENGSVKSETEYENGESNGKYVQYYENGQLFEEGTYKNGYWNGAYKQYHQNGQLKILNHYDNGKRDGDFERYNENGILISKFSYSNHKCDGDFEMFYPDGKKMIYIEDVKVEFDPIEISECQERNAKFRSQRRSLASILFEKEEICIKEPTDGITTMYAPNGDIVKETSMKNGRKDGVWKEYKDGKLIKEETFENGRLVQ